MCPPPGWKLRRYLSRAARGLCGGTKGVAVTGSPRAGGQPGEGPPLQPANYEYTSWDAKPNETEPSAFHKVGGPLV